MSYSFESRATIGFIHATFIIYKGSKQKALQVTRGPGSNPEGIAARLSVKRVEGSFSLVR